MTNSTAPQVCRFTCLSLTDEGRPPHLFHSRHPLEADQPPRTIAQSEVRVHRNRPRGLRRVDRTHGDLNEDTVRRRQTAWNLESRRVTRGLGIPPWRACRVVEG